MGDFPKIVNRVAVVVGTGASVTTTTFFARRATGRNPPSRPRRSTRLIACRLTQYGPTIAALGAGGSVAVLHETTRKYIAARVGKPRLLGGATSGVAASIAVADREFNVWYRGSGGALASGVETFLAATLPVA